VQHIVADQLAEGTPFGPQPVSTISGKKDAESLPEQRRKFIYYNF